MKTFEEKLKEDEFYNYLLKQRKFWEDKAAECEIERSAELGYERVLQQLLRIEEKYLEIANRAETQVMPKINGRCNTCKKEIENITEHEKFYYKTQTGNFKMVICCFDCQLQLTSIES